MAPALVELPREPPSYTVKAAPQGPTDYKQPFGGPEAYKRDIEEKGSEKQPPAKYPNYLPTWDLAKTYFVPILLNDEKLSRTGILLWSRLSIMSMEKMPIQASQICSKMPK